MSAAVHPCTAVALPANAQHLLAYYVEMLPDQLADEAPAIACDCWRHHHASCLGIVIQRAGSSG